MKQANVLEQTSMLRDHCGYDATTQANLKTHKHAIHGGIGFLCDLCGHDATALRLLMKHKQTIHECGKYSCDKC